MHRTIPAHRLLLPVALLALTSAVGFGWLASPRSSPNQALEQAMHQMDDAVKALGAGIKAEGRDAALAELAKFQTAVMAAKALAPDSAEKVDEKKRAAYVAEFKKTLIEALQFALTAEVAVLDGKYKEADTIVRNKLGGIKSTGHGKFKTDK